MKVLDFIDKLFPKSREWKGGAIIKSFTQNKLHNYNYINWYISQSIGLCDLWGIIFVGRDKYRIVPIVGVSIDSGSYLSWIILKVSLFRRFYIQVGIGKK